MCKNKSVSSYNDIFEKIIVLAVKNSEFFLATHQKFFAYLTYWKTRNNLDAIFLKPISQATKWSAFAHLQTFTKCSCRNLVFTFHNFSLAWSFICVCLPGLFFKNFSSTLELSNPVVNSDFRWSSVPVNLQLSLINVDFGIKNLTAARNSTAEGRLIWSYFASAVWKCLFRNLDFWRSHIRAFFKKISQLSHKW